MLRESPKLFLFLLQELLSGFVILRTEKRERQIKECWALTIISPQIECTFNFLFQPYPFVPWNHDYFNTFRFSHSHNVPVQTSTTTYNTFIFIVNRVKVGFNKLCCNTYLLHHKNTQNICIPAVSQAFWLLWNTAVKK